MKIYIITDTHFGHKKMMEYCGRPEGFESIILGNIAKLNPDDILIHLGDFCIGKDAYWAFQYRIASPARYWLIRGNHDYKSDLWYMEKGFEFVGNSFIGTYFGRKIMFSHTPQWYLQAENKESLFDLNIHGHFHNNAHRSEEKEMVARMTFRHRLLAIENENYKPVLLEEFINRK